MITQSSERDAGREAAVHERRPGLDARPVLVGLVGLALTLVVVVQLVISERRAGAARFQLEAEERVLAIRHQLDDLGASLLGLSVSFAVTGRVERSSLEELAAPALARHPFLHSVSWNPRVTAAERAAYEAALQADPGVRHGIRERTAASELVPAGARDDYFPVSIIVPEEGNEVALGFDAGSLPSWRAAFERACDTDALALAGPSALPRLRGAEALLALLPHYREGRAHATSAERRAALDGFFVGVIRLPELIETAIASLDPAEIEMHVIGSSAEESPRVLYAHRDPSHHATLAQGDPTHLHPGAGALRHVSELELGGHAWTLLLAAGDGYAASERSFEPWIALVGGVLTSGIMVLHLRSVSGRTRRVERLVAERTAELHDSNRVLAAEVAQRKQAEAALEQHRDLLEQRVKARTSELAEVNQELQHEIAQRRQAERTLREEEQRLRLTLESVADGVWDWNVASGEVEFSASWLRHFGFRRGDLRPHVSSWEAMIHPEDRARVSETLQRHLEGQTEVYQCEYRLRAASGEYRWSLDRGRVVRRDEEGRPLRMVGTDTDVTAQRRAAEERERLERQLHHAQKLESLGVLAGGIAHDFNNLLVAILGGADLALAELADGSSARVEIEQIQLAARRAAELTRQMLAYSGRSSVELERIALGTLVEEMVSLLRASISKKAELRCEFEPELPPVKGDATQLRQVVMNLITNASDALENRAGIIAVRTGVLDVDPSRLRGLLFGEKLEPGRYVYAEVSDTGVGMTPDVSARIFDPFFTTKFTGRGLGLAAVLGIVRSHGGAIRLRSAPGRGTTFTILLPPSDEHDAVKEAGASLASPGWRGSGSVLVADDEEAVRTLAARVLASAGFEVLTAADGREAVDLFRANAERVVLVLLDMTMPRMNGEEVFRELCRLRADVRVILSSGYEAQRSGDHATHSAGFAGFLQKPYRPQDLLEKVRMVLGV